MKINGKIENLLMFDGIDLTALSTGAEQPVEKDSEGVPTAWRLLKIGVNELTKDGHRLDLELSAGDVRQMEDYFKEKGVKIPVDSRHFLSKLANRLKVDESEVLNLLPDGKATLAFGDIAARADGVWLSNAEYKPLSRELMKEGVFRYFSPVIRGLADGRLRITSVAMENEPSINNIDAIAASAESADIINLTAGNARKETPEMKKLLAAIAGLLGMDTIALAADGDADDGIVGKINNLKTEVTTLRSGKTVADAFFGKVCDSLALGADVKPDVVHAALQGLIQKGQGYDTLKTRVDSLEMAAETDKCNKLIEQGRSDGKLADAQLDWAKGLDSVALSAYLDKAPSVVPLGGVKRQDLGGDPARSAAYKQGVEKGNLGAVVANAPILAD